MLKNILLRFALVVFLIGIEFDIAFADTIVNVSNHTELASALDCNCGASYFVYFTSDILYPSNNVSTPETLYAIRNPVTVDGQGHALTVERAYYNSTNTWNPAILFDIRADNVTVRNLTVNFSGIAFYIDAKGVSSDENYSWFGGKLIPSQNIIIEDIDVVSQGEYGFLAKELNNSVFNNLKIKNRGRAMKIAESKNVTLRNATFINSAMYDLMYYFVDGFSEQNVSYGLGKIASATDGWINLANFVVNASALGKSVSIGTFDVSATISGSIATVRLKYNKSLAQKLSVNESTISLYHRNSTNDWNKLSSIVNVNESYVEANVTQFSPFVIGGELLDTDGDGITDNLDLCIISPEDSDGYQDNDGCPEMDNDGDNILDADDLCPNQAENLNYYQDVDGCPDTLPANSTSIFSGGGIATNMVLGVSVNFSSVATGGLLIVSKNASNPVSVAVTGYDVVSDYYNMTTVANYTGNLTVCIMTETEPSYRLLHYDSVWDDITTVVEGDRICGIVSSLSPFVVAKPISLEPISQPSPSIGSSGGGGGSNIVLPSRPTLYVLSNDIDWELNREALSALGADVVRISPEEWPRKNLYFKPLVLGGYKAIGTGSIVSEVFGENLGALESRSNRWLIGQRFLLLAGSGRTETKRLVDSSLDRIKEWANP